MKTVTIKRVPPMFHDEINQADNGISVWVDGVNVMQSEKMEGTDYFASFRNYDYECSDGYAVFNCLESLERLGVIKLEVPDEDIAAHYGYNVEGS